MELYQLKSFLAIARESNLTRAAQALNLSQSALSSQLKLLEEELGVVLFQRTSRGMVLTEGGRTLQAHAQEVLQAAKRMRQKAITLHRGRGESLVIGLHADPGFLRVSDLQRRLALLHAHLEVAFSPCSTAGAVPALRQGSVDLGFCFGESFEADVEHLSLARVRSCVVIPPALIPVGKSLGWQEIASLPWVWGGTSRLFTRPCSITWSSTGSPPARRSAPPTRTRSGSWPWPARGSRCCGKTWPGPSRRRGAWSSGSAAGFSSP
ncbi:MAG: hypothetical protein C0617_13525 [Desulfuromonas sp.]|nr:MAG: hypothetical protein C0617_13525 [Desulfuromonas sp.]